MKLKLAIACWNFSRKVLLLRWQTKAQGLHKVCEPPLLRDFVSAQGELRGSHQPFSWKLGPCNALRGTARWAAGDCIVFWDSILLSGWENLVGSYGCTTLHDLRSTSWKPRLLQFQIPGNVEHCAECLRSSVLLGYSTALKSNSDVWHVKRLSHQMDKETTDAATEKRWETRDAGSQVGPKWLHLCRIPRTVLWLWWRWAIMAASRLTLRWKNLEGPVMGFWRSSWGCHRQTVDVKCQRNTNPGSSLIASRLALHRHVNPHWIPAHFSRSTILKPILSPITVWLAKSAKNPKVSTHHQSVDRVKGWYLHQETGDNHQLHPTNYTKNLENDLLFGGKYRKIPIGRLNPTF